MKNHVQIINVVLVTLLSFIQTHVKYQVSASLEGDCHSTYMLFINVTTDFHYFFVHNLISPLHDIFSVCIYALIAAPLAFSYKLHPNCKRNRH